MTGRPPLPIGTHGAIRQFQERGTWYARTTYRDRDGRRYVVRRSGATGPAAERALKAALVDFRAPLRAGELRDDMRVADLATVWLAELDAAVKEGRRSPGTADAYRSVLRTCVLPHLGQLRLREVDVPGVDRMITAATAGSSAARATTARSVISGMLALAIRRGAYRGPNPARGVIRIESTGPKRLPRSLTAPEREAWLAALRANQRARDWDLPDLTLLMLATGMRIGEALAVGWDEVDLAAGTLEVRWRLVRATGQGLQRRPTTKTGEEGERELPLPSWALVMLRRRKLATGGTGPVFPTELGTWRDPNNVRAVWRQVRAIGACGRCDPDGRLDGGRRCDHAGQPGDPALRQLVSHHLRKTVATHLDDADLRPRLVADQLGHTKVSMTTDVYLGRGLVDRRTADALETLFTKP